jgi:hypothetical protein
MRKEVAAVRVAGQMTAPEAARALGIGGSTLARLERRLGLTGPRTGKHAVRSYAPEHLQALRVHGRSAGRGAFLSPEGSSRGRDWGPTSIDETWTGRAVRDGAAAILRFETRTTAGAKPDPFPLELRCVHSAEEVFGASRDVIRCTPTKARDGFPWNDSVPVYLRVGLVLGVSHEIAVTISWEPEHAPSVSFGIAPWWDVR